MSFKMDDSYIDVATRIVEFREKHPEGSLQQMHYELMAVGERTFLAYTAAAYRTPDDPKPGIGTAWEPVPGPTAFTRDSEMQNAETAAWGRAIVAALAADTKRGIASAEEVRNRSTEPAPAEEPKPATRRMGLAVTPAQLVKIHAQLTDIGIGSDRERGLATLTEYAGRSEPLESSKHLTKAEASKVIKRLDEEITAAVPSLSEPPPESA